METLEVRATRASAQAGKRNSPRRSELEVKMDVLKVTMEGACKPTQIMYKANLSWVALLGHLESLTTLGLLRAVEYASRRVYEITPKGVQLLRAYEGVVSAVDGTSVENAATAWA